MVHGTWDFQRDKIDTHIEDNTQCIIYIDTELWYMVHWIFKEIGEIHIYRIILKV